MNLKKKVAKAQVSNYTLVLNIKNSKDRDKEIKKQQYQQSCRYIII